MNFIINSRIPEFKINTYRTGDFKVITDRDIKFKWKKYIFVIMKLEIYKITDSYPYDLLLLADETIDSINKYLFDSDIYVVKYADKDEIIGVCCLFDINTDIVEIKNIAVAEAYQGTGIGSYLINKIIEIAKKQEYKEVIVGTADCGIRQIHFYEKNGFEKYGIRENFFLDIFDYPIYENGVMLKDMVMLKKRV